MFGLGPLEIIILPIVILFVIGLPILFVAFLISLFFRRRGIRKGDRVQWNEETRLMQEMNEDLSRMETRIEALETILMERFGKDNK